MKEYSFIVTKEDETASIRRLLKKRLGFSSRLLASMHADGMVFINDKLLTGKSKPKPGDLIRAVMPNETSYFEPESIPFSVVYEDDAFMAVNKPAGYIVHPTKGKAEHTMANAISYYIADKGQRYKIRFVNRLDMDTSGLLIVAKDSFVQYDFSCQMKSDNLIKEYFAITHGIIKEDKICIDLPIGKPDIEDPRRSIVNDGSGKPSKTFVSVIARSSQGYSLLYIRIATGRTHQIRVHLSHIGHPIVGDSLYGTQKTDIIERHALHAYKLKLIHPVLRLPMSLAAPLPEDMRLAISKAGFDINEVKFL